MQCCQNCATAIVFQQGQSYAIYIIYSAHTIYNMQYDVFSLQYSQHTTYTTCRTSINAPPCRWCLRFSKTALTASLRRSVALSGAVRRCRRCRQRHTANTAASGVCADRADSADSADSATAPTAPTAPTAHDSADSADRGGRWLLPYW